MINSSNGLRGSAALSLSSSFYAASSSERAAYARLSLRPRVSKQKGKKKKREKRDSHLSITTFHFKSIMRHLLSHYLSCELPTVSPSTSDAAVSLSVYGFKAIVKQQ
jgi:predicted flavoprotein YhiN